MIAVFVGIAQLDAYLHRRNPLVLQQEDHISDVSSHYIARIRRNSSDRQHNVEQLVAVMNKLRAGWPGFHPTPQHRPFAYTDKNMLFSLYSRVSFAASKETGEPRQALLEVLVRTRPTPNEESLRDTFNQIVLQNGLLEALREK
ncbi:MAG: hypothetical protein K2Y21_05800 [Phycisphaerales bacterium]|nr:hypothetical protein [Phycisphaerales bacterium]